jgi:hypothetical protein
MNRALALLQKSRAGGQPCSRSPNPRLVNGLNFNSTTSSFKFLLEGCCIGLADTFLDNLVTSFNQVLCFLEAEAVIARTSLIAAIFLVGSQALRITLNSVGSSTAAAASATGPAATGGGGSHNTKLLFHHLDEVSDFHDGHTCDRFQNLFFSSHIIFSL